MALEAVAQILVAARVTHQAQAHHKVITVVAVQAVAVAVAELLLLVLMDLVELAETEVPEQHLQLQEQVLREQAVVVGATNHTVVEALAVLAVLVAEAMAVRAVTTAEPPEPRIPAVAVAEPGLEMVGRVRGVMAAPA